MALLLLRWHSGDPELENGQESWTPYSFSYDNAVRYADADGRNPGDYYTQQGEYLGTDGKADNAVYSASSVEKKQSGLVVSATDTEKIQVGLNEFLQMAAFAFNETYSGSNLDIDRFRIASTIVAQNNTEGVSMQRTLNGLRYGGDTHKNRLANYSKIAGVLTKEYSRFFKAKPDSRNLNSDMKSATAAAVNATSRNGKNYALSSDGKTTSKYWRGANKPNADKHNRYFSKSKVSPQNQVKNFKENEVRH